MWLFGSLWIERTVLYRVAVCAHMEPPVAVRSAPQAMAEMSFLPIAPVPDCSTLFPSCQAPTRCQTRYMMIIPCLIVLPPCSVRALPMPMEMSARMLPIPSELPKVHSTQGEGGHLGTLQGAAPSACTGTASAGPRSAP